MTTELVRQWRAIFPADDEIGSGLLTRWLEPHRRYHNADHLAAVLAIVDDHADLADDPAAVTIAAWYHDAVYDPRAEDNEERSAVLAEQTLPRLGVAPTRVAEVARLVRLTAGHQPEPGDRNGELLVDADLAILASSASGYDAYTRAVREEYVHVPDHSFKIDRATILQRLLGLPALYRIVPNRTAWTLRAHTNLRRELAALLDV